MKTICIDFDGVIYPNLKYHGVTDLRGAPIDGALDSLIGLSQEYNVVVHSARCDTEEGVIAIEKYLALHHFPFAVMRDKPRAHIYLDDRAVCFNGNWVDAINSIHGFKQWQTDQKSRNRILRKRRRRG